MASTKAVNDPAKVATSTTESKAEPAKKTVDPAEVLKTVVALEERIRQLEEKLAALNSGSTANASATAAPGSAPAPTAQQTADLSKEVATLKEEVKKNEGLLGFLKDIEVSGVVDGYYSYNNNKVDMFTQGRAFDVRHNAFSLQLAKVTLEKKNSIDSPLGFRVDLGVGETVDRVISVSDSSRNDATKHVLQAYASYVAPVGTG
ncbi:MAG TPA: outer membrane beta-barrel protein, partial [Blastocatellia bacterium]|nr:outer membrane beta-barrel protein [Blastocatellia bacterium]